MSKQYYVYIMTNVNHTVLYAGVTSNIEKRVYEHKNKSVSSFTSKYNISELVYFETYNNPAEAIRREKQIKAGSRKKKLQLINAQNPKWEDIAKQI